MIPVRVANDPGALQGARHRLRTSGGVTNRPASRQRPASSSSGRSSPPSKLPPLSDQDQRASFARTSRGRSGGRSRGGGSGSRGRPASASSASAGGGGKRHAYARTEGKPMESLGKKNLHSSAAARRKRCTKYLDKMRQFAYVRNSKITDMFMKYNTNGDNVIDYPEFLVMLNRMSMDKFMSEQEMKELFQFADPDGSGGIDLSEFNKVFGAQEPLARKAKKKEKLDENAAEFQKYAEEYATEAERAKAISRASELQSLVSAKLLQKKSASLGNNVRQDGRMYFMAFKQLDRDGDGIVTYDEFKESFGPNGFDLGLNDADMRDLILSIDQERTGLIECNTFLKRIRESDAPSASNPFSDHGKHVRAGMQRALKRLEETIATDPDDIKTPVDGMCPEGQVEDERLRPEVTKEGPNPFSAAQRDLQKGNKASKWEKPSEEALAKQAAADRRRAHTANLVQRLSSTPHWEDLARGGAAGFQTVQQQRIKVARQRKAREAGGSFRLSYAPRDPNAAVHTYKSKASTPKPHDTYSTVGYGRDDTSLHAKPDTFNDKERKYARQRAKARINAEHHKRIWNYRRKQDVQTKLQDAARLASKIRQREDYLARAAEEGDRLYKAFVGRKGLYDSEISQRQRFGNMRHYGDKAADWSERYSGGVNIPL